MKSITCLVGALLILSACTTTKPSVLIQNELIKGQVPPALLKDCPKPWGKEIRITEDFIKRGDVNEAALRKCAAQIAAIRKWDERP